MFSIFEKIRFIIATKFHTVQAHRADRLAKRDKRLWVRILKGVVTTIAVMVVFLFAFGLFLSYFSSPTVIVSDSNDKVIETSESPYMINGHLSSSRKSTLKINGRKVELVGNDFSMTVELKPGSNKFIIEASNDRGVTKEIYIIRYVAPVNAQK